MSQITTPLLNEPLVGRDGRMTPPWYVHFRGEEESGAAAPHTVVSPLNLTTQSAAIGLTPIPTDVLTSGLYRLTYFLRITTPASISSSATPSVTFTSGGVACTFTGAAVTGNTTASVGTGTFLMKVDAASPISYQVAYASNAAGMVYEISIVLERINA